MRNDLNLYKISSNYRSYFLQIVWFSKTEKWLLHTAPQTCIGIFNTIYSIKEMILLFHTSKMPNTVPLE